MNGKIAPEDYIPLIPESEQKTFDSEVASSDEFQKVLNDLYMDDVDDMELVELSEFAVLSPISTEKPQTADLIKLQLSPEKMMIVKEVLEIFSVNQKNIQYMEDELDIGLYDQQTQVRDIRDEINNYLDVYVKNRPYSPFFQSWIKRIGKSDVRKM